MHPLFSQTVSSRFQEHAADTPVIFLPGWGFDGRICELVRPAWNWIYPVVHLAPRKLLEALQDLVSEQRFERLRLVGWSLGAMLALEFAGRQPGRVEALDLIAMRRQWPVAEIDQIRAELRLDCGEFLAGFYRKCFLGLQEVYRNFKLSLQDEYIRDADLDTLLQGLDYLQKADWRPVAGVKTSIIHGRHDIIAPVDERVAIPEAAVEIVDHAGHMVFLSSSCSLRQDRLKEEIRQGFSRAAATYDTQARLQKELAARLADDRILAPAGRPVRRVLEIGCGTGSYTLLLAGHFPAAAILALDFSPEMVQRARQRLGRRSNVEWICEDGERYLQQAASGKRQQFDLITSNATLQWFADLPHTFGHMAALLPASGLLLCSLFGPRSLAELGQGLAAVLGRQPHLAAARFPTREELLDSLGTLFSEYEVEEQIFQYSYASAHELLRQIKRTGATGWHDSAPLVLSRSLLSRLNDWFVANHGGCQVGYQVFFLRCRK